MGSSTSTDTALPTPPHGDVDAVVAWVEQHLGHLTDGQPVAASPAFRGGQQAADAALAGADLTGYSRERNEVFPSHRRGASKLSPYIRHGLLSLPRMWRFAGTSASGRDRSKYRDELLWQEYARHLYARLGRATGESLRHLQGRLDWDAGEDPFQFDAVRAPDTGPAMACIDLCSDELLTDGWLVNQTRMWMASQWSVRHGADWREGEDRFFTHLLDGSRAANRLGWQWTVGTGNGKAYGFSRWQVEKRAPGLCRSCELSNDCPIQDWPEDADLPKADEDPRLRGIDPAQLDAVRGPRQVEQRGPDPQAVWLTAESLGDVDPALVGHPELPARFVFDAPLLDRLRLSGKRLVFLAECLADLATRREVQVDLGDPVEVLDGTRLAVTFAPVPGYRDRSRALDVVTEHPWPWLRQPETGSLSSFTTWRKRTDKQR